MRRKTRASASRHSNQITITRINLCEFRKQAASNILQKFTFKYSLWSNDRQECYKISYWTDEFVEIFRAIEKELYIEIYVIMLDDKIKKTSEYVNENNQKLSSWKVEPSTSAKNCRNFIREVVDNLNLEPNPNKRVIALSIGKHI